MLTQPHDDPWDERGDVVREGLHDGAQSQHPRVPVDEVLRSHDVRPLLLQHRTAQLLETTLEITA